MDGWGRGNEDAVAETSMANASRQPAIFGMPDHSDRGSPTMVAPVPLLLPPLLCLLLLAAAPSSALPTPPSSSKVPSLQQQKEELHLQG